MRELQGTPPDLTADFKGFFIKGFTALRSMIGAKGALQAMETNERLTTSTYEKASGLGWPATLPQSSAQTGPTSSAISPSSARQSREAMSDFG